MSSYLTRKSGTVFALVALLVTLSVFSVASAHSTSVVVPSAQTAVEGSLNNGFPFQRLSMRYQQVYDVSDMGIAGPHLVTQIAFRPDGQIGFAFTTTLPNVQINLSTTSAGPDGLSNTFASNVGPDDAVVHSGPLSLSSSDTGPAGGPMAFDIVIPITPFRYDPSEGNLLLDVRVITGLINAVSTFDTEQGVDSVSRLNTSFSGGSVTDPTGVTNSFGLITQFSFVDAEIQETPIEVDIKPGNDHNSISLDTHVIPVAILSSPDFDAPNTVDRASLTFGRTGDEESLVLGHDGDFACRVKDVNDDGLHDLVCLFSTQISGFQTGDTEGILKGQTLDGVPVAGRDSVVIHD